MKDLGPCSEVGTQGKFLYFFSVAGEVQYPLLLEQSLGKMYSKKPVLLGGQEVFIADEGRQQVPEFGAMCRSDQVFKLMKKTGLSQLVYGFVRKSLCSSHVALPGCEWGVWSSQLFLMSGFSDTQGS